jgi:hypothetical protein
MSNGTGLGRHAFGACKSFQVVMACIASCLILLGLATTLRSKGKDWTGVPFALAICVIAYVTISTVKIDIRADGFTYRNWYGKRTIAFANVQRTSWDRGDWVHQSSGFPVKIHLPTLPVRAAAILFGCLEMYDVPTEGPYTQTSARMLSEIRAEMQRIKSGA